MTPSQPKTDATPGPWHVARRGLSPAVRDAEMRLIAECPYHDNHRANYPLIGEAVANAQLIASAPALLASHQRLAEALEEIIATDVLSPEGGHEAVAEIHCIARAALASIPKEPT